MSDIIDDANDRSERDLNRAIAAVRSRPAMRPTGLCRYCDEPVGPSALFCDKACAEDFEAEARIRARQGARP